MLTGNINMRTLRSSPYIEIIEQPAPRAVRFRYRSEGRASATLIGINSTKECPTFPKIRVYGLTSEAYVAVSCVTTDEPYRIHPHSLKNSEMVDPDKYPGIIGVRVDPCDREVTFSNVKLECVPKENAKRALQAKAAFPMNPFPFPWEDSDISAIDLSSVRLCFQLITEHPITRKAQAVYSAVSEPIHDQKKFNALEIYRLTTHAGSVAGGNELTMLCKKVGTRNDLQVRFFEEKAGKVVWQAFVDPKNLQFFKQISISLETPAYHNVNVSGPVSAYMQLVRTSDGQKSDAVPFRFEPLPCNRKKQPRKQNAAVMNSLKRNKCNCILEPILRPDCQIHGQQKENRVKNIMDERVPPPRKVLKASVSHMNATQGQIRPNFNEMSNLKSQSFYRKSKNIPVSNNIPGSSQPSKKTIVPTTPVRVPASTPTYEGPQQKIITKPLIKSLRKNSRNSDVIMKEINSEDIEEMDSDTVS